MHHGDDTDDPRTELATFNPPRRGVAGQTGTYQIVFNNGSIVTLEKVALSTFSGPGGSWPVFKAFFIGGGWQTVSFGATGSGSLDPRQIAAIVRTSEDLNDPAVVENVEAGQTEDGVETLKVWVLSHAQHLARLAIRLDGRAGILTIDELEIDIAEPARLDGGPGLVFTALLAGTESLASLELDADQRALVLSIVGASTRYPIEAVEAERFTTWIERSGLEPSSARPAGFVEESQEHWTHLEALLDPVGAIVDAEVEAGTKRRRGYTDAEREALEAVYFDTIDYDEVVITGRHFFSAFLPKHAAMVLGAKIIYPIKGWRADFSDDMALLTHETCHVWQTRNIPGYCALRAMLEHIRYGRKVYEYSIWDHDRLTDFRFEQQGQIMQDWWGIRDNILVPEQLRKRYAQVIHASLPGSWPVE